ncbi:hypothetical protein D8B26_006886 [Coccidioides posadasii str. Silveira]|uniref:Uncharacterized protein n=2 Tax=Coccidioides posadasii TaxID=199306 RepID=E9CS76_COCPS|nr:hypothetical protein CPC735_035420 [Coccidioides posadasii C735 delta SOWgp]EER28206.1 hypothetical protein CPC735_035420 [Coccidioides posadasii C735 delta SOWgp]EFW23397.1 conserved hypothetical protein [Coccidioides posadasii str. Silveira]QVM12253.1 hypothetical protein D8B26_006886 [Coccidioides posadasii str. Silveira]|eukprot:XP_003070351.1 hypothetical protein CPC735_035420 [Coccidioides posadasii C735 delta SOWgp]
MPETLESSSQEDRLAELKRLASAKEAIKDYNSAADLYSRAVEIQAELNGEMAIDNADLLYSYGRCLYHVAVSKSDVFGSKAAVQNVVESSKPRGKESSNQPQFFMPQSDKNDTSTEDKAAAERDVKTNSDTGTNKTYFQFNGDENFDDDDEDEEDAGDTGREALVEDDDFENAFETLDMARVLLSRQLDSILLSFSGEKGVPESTEIRRLKERLSDIYDLQAEISLEGERFSEAVSDLRAALKLKRELFPPGDSTVAECHYKLSLALEFSSVTQTSGEDSHVTSQVDLQMRAEAAKHMEAAIQCCKFRISSEEEKLAGMGSGNIQELAKLSRNIEDVKEIVADMQQRLTDLLHPPNSITDSFQVPDRVLENSILNQVQSPAGKVLLEEAIKGANDLNAFVRKRKRNPSTAETRESLEEPAPYKEMKRPST